MQNSRYRSVFVSDIHLGSRSCQADYLCDWLKNNTSDNLYLVGDIIDFWKLNRSVYWPQSHSNVIRRILTAAKRGTKVKYVLGNHDEVLRSWVGELTANFGNIEMANQFDHVLTNDDRFLVTHGDLFDSVIRYHKWLSMIGDQAYAFLLLLNQGINRIRAWMGLDYWSFSRYIKTNTKQAVAFVTKFEECLQNHAVKNGYQGVICGHIHTPALKVVTNLVYVNTGDWCETISAVVEHHSGEIELLVWNRASGKLGTQNTWTPQ
jgi:UDP-2,3-diacylglucosamine pyrophosphatase LpxH